MLRTTTTLLLAMTATAAAEPNASTDATQPTESTDAKPADATPDAKADAKPNAKADPTDAKAEPTKQVAALEPGPADEPRVDAGAPKPAAEHTPRFELAGGVFVQSRGLDFNFDPNADGAPPSYPASNLSGFALQGAIYPLPIDNSSKLSGIGFSFKLAKSVGATLTADDGDTIGDYPIEYLAYEAGVHYRYPIDKVAIDGEIAYGNQSHTVVGLPETVEVPDTAFQYVAAGVHVDFFPSEHASIGVGAKYLSVLSTGDVGSDSWYGSGSAGGVILDASVSVPLPAHLFLRGGLEYRKFWIDFDGSGDLSDAYGVGSMTDTSVVGSALLGVQF